MTSSLSTTADAREAARHDDGKFGTQPLGTSGDVDLAPAISARAFDAPEVFTTKYDTVQDKVDAYRAELEKAVADLDKDENWLDYLDTMSKFHRYSPTNQLLIMLQTDGQATHVAGFRAWQDKFGRSVNKGEKSIGILAPRIVNVTEKDANGNPKKGADGKPIKRTQCIGFTTAAVFDVAQTDGKPLPELERELSEEPPAGFVDDMVEAAKVAGFEVEFREMDSHAKGTAQGWTDPRSKKIVVDASLSAGSRAHTLAHELGHVHAGHCDPDAMGKYHTGPGGCRGKYELEADSISYALTRSNGMAAGQSTKLTAQYVHGWTGGDKEMLKDSADTVSKSLKSILGSTKFRNALD